ncbi:MAG: hypothetical protein ACI8ZW_001528 [Yoonia sp.]|jgi:hypothetical protein
MPGAVDIHLLAKRGVMLDQMRARPDHAHLPAQHVNQLREIVDTGAAHELTELENTAARLTADFLRRSRPTNPSYASPAARPD